MLKFVHSFLALFVSCVPSVQLSHTVFGCVPQALRETALSSELALSQLGERDAAALISRGVSGATVDALRALGAQFANVRRDIFVVLVFCAGASRWLVHTS